MVVYVCVCEVCTCSHRSVHVCVHMEARGSPRGSETSFLPGPGDRGVAQMAAVLPGSHTAPADVFLALPKGLTQQVRCLSHARHATS